MPGWDCSRRYSSPSGFQGHLARSQQSISGPRVLPEAAAGGPWSIPTLIAARIVCGRGSDQLMPLKRPTWGAMLARPRLLRRGGRQRRPTPGRNQRWAPSSPWARPGEGANPSGFANGQ